MGVLAHVVENDRAPADPQRLVATPGGQLLFAEPHHGAKREFKEPLALTRQPFVPALLAQGNVVEQPAAVEIGRCAQGIAAALTDKGLEPADIALDGGRIEPDDLAVALE